MFNFFKKKKPEDVFRKRVRDGFDESVKNVKHRLIGDPMMDGMLVQSAIANFAKAMKESPEIMIIGLGAKGWMPEIIIDEELQRALKKYIKF